MPPASLADIPDCARWFLASESCAVLIWRDGGVILAINEKAGRLLAGVGCAWAPAVTTVRDVFVMADTANAEDLALALGSDGPRARLLGNSDHPESRLLVASWSLPADGGLWATLVTDAAPLAAQLKQVDTAAAHMELLYQRSPLMYFTVTADGRILTANRTAIEHLGYPIESVVGTPVSDVFHEDDRDTVQRQIARCFREPDVTHAWELRKIRHDGEVIWVAEWARTLPDTGHPPELLLICEDITARKRAEQALRDSEARLLQAQKQEALGRLAGGIAHDFSNLLTVVLGHCEAARHQLPRESPVIEELDSIREAAQQATNLSRQLLTFSRRQVVQPQPLQLDDVLTRMTPLFKRLLGASVGLQIVWLPGLPQVLADPGQMEQVLTNLIVNARDAIGESGTVRITSSLVSASAFSTDTGAPGTPGRTYLCISIKDDGPGMSEDVRRRAFEPFFTTKADDRGTGLGLPTVQSIVTHAGGGVGLQSAPGQGCDVRIYLPTLAAATPPTPATTAARPLPGGTETILLVEDREAVRRVAQRFLSRRGYNVIEAESAEEALVLAETHAAEIDLLLSDVVLGGMDGYELALALSGKLPGVRIVLMSGYPSEMLARAGSSGPVFPFVNKPIDFSTLAQLIRDLLDSRTMR
ncbi:MAG TPA: PAS domain S-box protein [Luteitalea sp.]|nr:PAS domain S-box protein [Luteitalea sp.]